MQCYRLRNRKVKAGILCRYGKIEKVAVVIDLERYDKVDVL